MKIGSKMIFPMKWKFRENVAGKVWRVMESLEGFMKLHKFFMEFHFVYV